VRDSAGGALERPRRQQRGGRVGDDLAGEAAARPHRDPSDELGALAVAAQVVAHVEADRAVGGQLEPTLVGVVDADVEPDRHAGELAGHAPARAGGEPPAVELLEVEVDRRPAPDLRGMRQHLQHLAGCGVRSRRCRPLRHGRQPLTG
jgi:hypothetical protein